MISSRRGLIVLVVIALVLGAWLARAVTRARPGPVDRAIAPGLDVERISELAWDRSPLPAVKITPARGGGWRWDSDDSWAAADGSAVRDMLAALRAGRWHRRAEAKAAGAVRAQLTVKEGTTSRTIGIGQPLEGTEQQWLVSGEEALLVDRWVARALEPDPLALRIRHPVENAAAAGTITIDHGEAHLRLEPGPRRLVAPVTLLPSTEAIAAFFHALEAIEIVRLSRPARDGEVTLAIHAGGALRFVPSCPDEPSLAWVFSDAGNGCIPRAQYEEVVRAASAFEKPPLELAEPRLVPLDITGVVLVDGKRIELSGKPVIEGRPADAGAIAELLAALGAPGQVVAPVVGAAVQQQLVAVLKGGGEIAIELLGRGMVRRGNEAVVLQLTPAAYAALGRTAADFTDRTLWNEEPTTITEIRIDAVAYRRGAVVGEWTRTPTAPVDGARIEALVSALAQLQASPGVGAVSKQHSVTLEITPPAGASVRHALVVGAPGQGGCAAQAGAAAAILPAKVCAELAALAR